MADHANLPYDLIERLNILVGKCSKVQQAASKIARHGVDGSDPRRKGSDNMTDLEATIGELMCIIELFMMMGDLHPEVVGQFLHKEANELQSWTHHQSLKALQTLYSGVQDEEIIETVPLILKPDSTQ